MKITPVKAPVLNPMMPQGAQDTRPGFKDTLMESIHQVNNIQTKAHSAMEDLATGKANNLHETMIVMQKAEISFKMMMQVRNKIMNAYQEVMRMQV